MLCRLQQPVRERSVGAFPEKRLVIEPANTAVPRRSSPPRVEFRETSLATRREWRRLYISRLYNVQQFWQAFFFVSNQYSQYIFPVRTGDARKKTKFLVSYTPIFRNCQKKSGKASSSWSKSREEGVESSVMSYLSNGNIQCILRLQMY